MHAAVVIPITVCNDSAGRLSPVSPGKAAAMTTFVLGFQCR
jgi:hypothetical protein